MKEYIIARIEQTLKEMDQAETTTELLIFQAKLKVYEEILDKVEVL